jgi:hypothetical protein
MRYVVLSVLSLMLAVTLLAPQSSAADKIERLTGTVKRISKDTSTIEIAAGSALSHTVIYSSDTKFTKRKAPGSIDDLKEGRRVICLGKFDDKARLLASQIDVRTE